MRRLFRPIVLLVLVLAVPVLPFLGFGAAIEAWAQSWRDNPPSPPATAVLVVALLSTDILLPIPSSIVSTVAGAQLGTLGGTLASFVGMTLGAIFGFAVARLWGRRVALWFTKPQDLARMEELTLRFGATVLVITRAVPILAEAGVLLMGIHRLPWRKFLPPVILANLGLSLVYALSGESLSFIMSMAGAIALPVLAACIVRWCWPEEEAQSEQRELQSKEKS